MRHYREFKLKKKNEDELVQLLKKLSDIESEDWFINNKFSDEFAEENDIPKEHVISFLSPYFKDEAEDEDKTVYRGIVYFGINNNTLMILDIVGQFIEKKLPTLRYNFVLHHFVNDIIYPNKDLLEDYVGTIRRKRNKPSIPQKSKPKKQGKSLVITRSPDEYEVFNYRLKKPIHFFDPEDNGEMLLQQADDIQLDGQTVEYFTPNNIGLLLSVSRNAKKEAKELFKKLTEENGISNPVEKIKNKSKLVCDYIEKIQITIVFSYTALEAFANLSIPDDYEFQNIESRNGVHYKKTFKRDSIERLFPLKQKLTEILPDIYETKPIEDENFWGRFPNLEDLRHKIIHQKTIEHTEFYKEYFNRSVFDLCGVAEEIIHFFYENSMHHYSTNPLWPWITGKEDVFPRKQYNPEWFKKSGSIYEEE